VTGVRFHLRKCARKIIGGDLVCWNQSFLDEILVPLLQNVVMLCKVCVVVRALSISQCHNDHIATLFQRLLLGCVRISVDVVSLHHECNLTIAIVMSGRIRKRGSKIVDRKHEWPVPSFLVDEQRVEHVLQDRCVEVNRDRMEWEDDVDSLYVAIAADLFQEDVWCLRGVGKFQSTEGLPCCERGEAEIILTSSRERVGRHLRVEG